MSDEKLWLQNKIDELHKYVDLLVTDYDDGLVTRADLTQRVSTMCKDSLTTTYDHAFTEGINAAYLDGDSEEEVDFEFEEDQDEGDEG